MLLPPARDKPQGGYERVSHPLTLKICHFAGKKQYNIYLQHYLLDPELFDQLLIVGKKVPEKILIG